MITKVLCVAHGWDGRPQARGQAGAGPGVLDDTGARGRSHGLSCILEWSAGEGRLPPAGRSFQPGAEEDAKGGLWESWFPGARVGQPGGGVHPGRPIHRQESVAKGKTSGLAPSRYWAFLPQGLVGGRGGARTQSRRGRLLGGPVGRKVLPLPRAGWGTEYARGSGWIGGTTGGTEEGQDDGCQTASPRKAKNL